MSSESTSDIHILARGISISLAGRLVGRVVMMLTQVVLARILGVVAFGLYSIGYSVLRIGEIFVPIGLEQAVVRFGVIRKGGQPNIRGVVIKKTLILALFSGFFFGLVTYLLAPILANSVFHDVRLKVVLRLIAFSFILLSILQVGAAATRISKHVQFATITVDLIQPISNLILAILFLILGWALVGTLWALIGSYGLASIAVCLILIWLFPGFSQDLDRTAPSFFELLRFSFPASFARVFASLIMMFDRVLIGFFRPMEDVGVYQAASLVSTIFPIILVSINAIFSPMITDFHRSGLRERLDKIYKISTRWGISLGLPILLFVVAFPEWLLISVFGEEYAGGVIPLLLLASAQFANLAVGGVGVLLTMTGNQAQWARISAVAFVSHIFLSVALIPRFGLQGAALASGIAITGLFFTGLIVVRRREGYWPYDHRTRKALVAALFAAGVLALGRFSFPDLSTAGVLLIGTLTMGVYSLAIWFQGIEDEDKEILGVVRSRLGGGFNKSREG